MNEVKPARWRYSSVQQFKRWAKYIHLRDGLLIKHDGIESPVIVCYSLLVDLVATTHVKLNHIGRLKLLGVLKPYFWHPALENTCREVCRTCKHCQFYKTHNQDLVPTRKIESRFPFELSAVDLLQFNRSKSGNVALVVFLDHFSKWLAAIPIRDKRSTTVARVLRENIFPFLPRIPSGLLTDNGPEFKGREFESCMSEFNINHLYISPYHAQGNGAVERINRTLIQLVKGDLNGIDWDVRIGNVVIAYNNTVHSQLGMSPSQCILNKVYDTKVRPPLDRDVQKLEGGSSEFLSFPDWTMGIEEEA